MNPPLSISQLKQLRLIMQKMLSEAKNTNWQELSRLDSERRVLINYKAISVNSRNLENSLAPSQNPKPSGVEIDKISQLRSGSNMTATRSPSALTGVSASSKPDAEYLALSKELTAIDLEISKTVQAARQALLEQTRGLKAQVSAKKEYEQANIMKVSSYS